MATALLLVLFLALFPALIKGIASLENHLSKRSRQQSFHFNSQ